MTRSPSRKNCARSFHAKCERGTNDSLLWRRMSHSANPGNQAGKRAATSIKSRRRLFCKVILIACRRIGTKVRRRQIFNQKLLHLF